MSSQPGTIPVMDAVGREPARHVLVVADGDVPPRADLDADWPGWADGIAAVIAADGGYARAMALGFVPDALVGDLDSLAPELAAAAGRAGTRIVRHPAAKDESDTELALLEAAAAGAARVTLLGAIGGARFDHTLGNVWLLAHPMLAGIDLALVGARTRVRLLTAPGPDGAPARLSIPGPPGAIVTLLPFAGDALGVTTHGLEYPLRDEPLPTGRTRGLSNVRSSADARVSLRSGRLLVLEQPVPGRAGRSGSILPA